MTPRIALYIFLAWALVQLALLVVAHLQHRLMPAMRGAFEKVATSKTETEKHEMTKGFVWISLVWFVLNAIVTVIAGFAFVSAADRSTWGTIIFIAVGAWSVYETASNPFVIGRMYPGSVGWHDWTAAIVGSLVWLNLFVVVVVRWVDRAA